MTKTFDSLYESYLAEMMPVGAEFGEFTGGLRSGIGSAPGEGYLIGAIAKALNISKEEAVNTIAAGLYDKLFGAEGINPANTEEEYRAAITDALGTVVNDLKKQYPEAKIPGAAAIRGYTARVISSLGTATKEFGEKVTATDVKSAIEDAASEEAPEEETPTEVTKKASASAPAPVAGFKPSKDYYLKNREEIPSGTLKGDLEAIYDRLSGAAGEVTTGTDLEKVLRKSGTEQGRITSYLRKLVELGVLEASEEDGGNGSGGALEAGEDRKGYERREFERNPELMAAYKDWKSAGGGNGFGVDFG